MTNVIANERGLLIKQWPLNCCCFWKCFLCQVPHRREDEEGGIEESIPLLLIALNPGSDPEHVSDGVADRKRRPEISELFHDLPPFLECAHYDYLVVGFDRVPIFNILNIAYIYLKVKPNRKSPCYRAFSGISYWIKNFSSPKIKIWFEPIFFSGFFYGFERCGSAAFPNFCGGNFSEKCVRTNSRILHQTGKVKEFWFASLRSATKLLIVYYLQNRLFGSSSVLA